MNIVLLYAAKVAFYLIAFYVVYALLLGRDTMYSRNRTFILLSLAASFLFPVFTFQTVRPLDIQFFGKFLSEVLISGTATNGSETPQSDLRLDLPYTIFIIYATGTIAFLARLLLNVANLFYLIMRHKSDSSGIIRFHGFNTAGFSAMGYIFINEKLSAAEAEPVIKHEQNHLRLNHFVDIIFIEVVKSLQWFNPAAHLFDRSLRAVHEFQADEGCISSGIPVARYQSILISQVFRTGGVNLTNSFSNPSLIKRRMIMMTKKRSSSLAYLKLFAALPAAAFVFFAISAYREIPENVLSGYISEIPDNALQNSGNNTTSIQILKSPADKPSATINPVKKASLKTENEAPPPPPPPVPTPKSQSPGDSKLADATETDPFVVVEEMPMFEGGDAALLRFIGENTVYPQAAKENNIQGRVIIRFCITENGGINRISVIKGVSPELDSEAMRVVSTLPDFHPGRQGGKAVPVWFSVPITFTLK
ncbi:MAG: TonB family protein [Bacteroidales bacterium]|nr:TonB family protein [Bacteroidales bacterium]